MKASARDCNQGGDVERQASKGTWGEEAAGTSRPSPPALGRVSPVFLSSYCFLCLSNTEVNGILSVAASQRDDPTSRPMKSTMETKDESHHH